MYQLYHAESWSLEEYRPYNTKIHCVGLFVLMELFPFVTDLSTSIFARYEFSSLVQNDCTTQSFKLFKKVNSYNFKTIAVILLFLNFTNTKIILPSLLYITKILKLFL